MTPAKLTCPNAKYDSNMNIRCEKRDEMCAHQRWCMYKGWSVLTDMAANCPARRENTDEQPERKRTPKRRNKV